MSSRRSCLISLHIQYMFICFFDKNMIRLFGADNSRNYIPNTIFPNLFFMGINTNGVDINTILPRKRLRAIHRISLLSVQYENRCSRKHWYANPVLHKLMFKRNKLEYESGKLHTYNAIFLLTQSYCYHSNAYHTGTNILQGHKEIG